MMVTLNLALCLTTLFIIIIAFLESYIDYSNQPKLKRDTLINMCWNIVGGAMVYVCKIVVILVILIALFSVFGYTALLTYEAGVLNGMF